MWEESCYQWNYHDFSTQGYLKVNISSTFIWNAFFISYNNVMIEICHCYWKIVDEHENSRKVTLKGEKLESQYSPFQTKHFHRTFVCICKSNKDIKADKINITPCMLIVMDLLHFRLSYSLLINLLASKVISQVMCLKVYVLEWIFRVARVYQLGYCYNN